MDEEEASRKDGAGHWLIPKSRPSLCFRAVEAVGYHDDYFMTYTFVASFVGDAMSAIRCTLTVKNGEVAIAFRLETAGLTLNVSGSG